MTCDKSRCEIARPILDKVRLNRKIDRHRNMWRVALNGKRYEFTNKRAALDFCRQVDQWLNDQFDQVNNALVMAFSITRRLHRSMHSSERQMLRQDIATIEAGIDLTLRRSDWDNWSTITFVKLRNSLQLLDGIAEICLSVASSKNYTVLKTECKALSKLMHMLRVDHDAFELEARQYRVEQDTTRIFTIQKNTG